jgi:hypothetical protein
VPVSRLARHDSAGRCRLGTVREHGMRNECVQGQPLQSYFASAVIDNPDNAELRFDLTHLNIKNFTAPNLSHYSLNYQAADTHVDDKAGLSKWLTVSIHSPNLYRELNFDSWAKSSIHGRHCAS